MTTTLIISDSAANELRIALGAAPAPAPTPTPPPAPSESPLGATATAGVGSVTDYLGHTWVIDAGLTSDGFHIVKRDGAVTGSTATMLYWSHPTLYVQGGRTFPQWWAMDVAALTSVQCPDPRPVPAPAPSPTPTTISLLSGECSTIAPTGNTISDMLVVLNPRSQLSDYEPSGPKWVGLFAGLNGVQSKAPHIRVPLTDWLAGTSANRPMYSYTPSLPSTWVPFDTVTNANSVLEFWNSVGFAMPQVWIAFQPCWRPSDMLAYIATPLAGAVRAPDVLTAPTSDELGRAVPALPIASLHVASGGTRVVNIVAGLHAYEHLGPLSWRGLYEWLVSTDPKAALARSAFDFRMAPLVNAAGFTAGYWRGEPGNTLDTNRHWLTGPASDCVTKIKPVLAPSCSVWLDFHSNNNAEGTSCYVGGALAADFQSALSMYAPATTYLPNITESSGDYGLSIGARLAVTAEISWANVSAQTCYNWGANIGRALVDLFVAGKL